ncbi:MAG TPA: hypothetical protein VI685_15760 [Candidatus Angelobacter sp.]
MSTASPRRLSAEIEFYESQKTEWLKSHRDQFAVVKGNDVLGFFTDFHRAYLAGATEYGIDTDFLVRRVVLHEPMFVVF